MGNVPHVVIQRGGKEEIERKNLQIDFCPLIPHVFSSVEIAVSSIFVMLPSGASVQVGISDSEAVGVGDGFADGALLGVLVGLIVGRSVGVGGADGFRVGQGDSGTVGDDTLKTTVGGPVSASSVPGDSSVPAFAIGIASLWLPAATSVSVGAHDQSMVGGKVLVSSSSLVGGSVWGLSSQSQPH